MNPKDTLSALTLAAKNSEEPVTWPADSRAATGPVIVKPVVNALRILRYLTHTGTPERAADIARHLSINPSTCFNILRTLVAEEVVDFNGRSKTYSVGLGLARLLGSASDTL